MNLDDFADQTPVLILVDKETNERFTRCEICLKLGIGNGALADLGDCPICYRYTRLNSNGTCGREDCARLWKREKRLAIKTSV